MQNLQELKNDKQREKNYVNYSRNFIVFLGKFIIKFGSATLFQIFEVLQQGLLNLLLKSEFDKVYSLGSILEKKIALYGVCLFLNEYFKSLTPETVLFIVTQCVKILESFYKLGTSFSMETGFDLQENLVFVSNSNNKLQNAEIKVFFVNSRYRLKSIIKYTKLIRMRFFSL